MVDILIVDDHADTGRTLVSIFRMGRRTAAYVDSGPAALEYLRHGDLPRMILLDFAMPQMNGLEVLRAVRSDDRTRTVPVVMYSAMLDDHLSYQAIQAGANACWRKANLSIEELLDGVARQLI